VLGLVQFIHLHGYAVLYEPWLCFFTCNRKEEYEMLARNHPELEPAVFCARKMSLIEKWRDIQFHKNLWKVDERMLMEQARLDGHAEGKAKGKAEGLAEGKAEGLAAGEAKSREEIARNALAKGLPVEMIHDITGLLPEAIQNL
jgi:flagellar biosynthesis/type III secretory pathway protein FliH